MSQIINNNTDEAKRVIGEADDLINNVLYFNNEWDMETCFTPYKVDWKDWTHSPNKDAEWVYMMNRLEYLTRLLVADYITGNHKYLVKWVDIVRNWQLYGKNQYRNADNAQLFKKGISFVSKYINFGSMKFHSFSGYRPLDVALRCISLLEGISYINTSDYLDKESIIDINSDVEKEANYIIEHWEDWYEQSNWGLIISSSVLYCGFFLNNERYINWAGTKIPLMTSLQYDADGIQFEGSPMYAVQVAVLFAKIKTVFPDKLCENLDAIFTSVCQSTFNFLIAIQTPDGKLPTIGDSDSTPLASILYVLSCLLYNEAINIDSPNYVTLFPFRNILNKDVSHGNVKSVSFVSFESGLSAVHNHNNDYLLVTNGKCYSGHRHMDNGSFVLYKSGKKIIIDSGRYTYKKSRERDFFRSESAHNTILIDGQGFTGCKGVWGVLKYPVWHENYVRDFNNGTVVLLSTKYVGEVKNSCSLVERYFILTADNDILIVSHVYFPGKHNCGELFHLANSCSVTNDDVACIFRTDGNECYFSFENSWHLDFKKSICSDNYGELKNNITIETSKSFKDHYISLFCISDKKIELTLETLNSLCGIFILSKDNSLAYKLKYNFHTTGIKSRLNNDGENQIENLILEYNFLKNSEPIIVIIK